MGSIIKEYTSRNWSPIELKEELFRLIKDYNQYTKSFLIIYASDSTKRFIQNLPIALDQEDYYAIHDLLREVKSDSLDFYIETPGGSGEAAEEIARFLHKKFKTSNFVIAGEAKSAGTILTLSGDDISMTDSGSLGPIDAQVRIGRTVVSAHDYLEWISNKRKEAAAGGKLNPVDAIIVAQISPGEIAGINLSLDFAKRLVKEWLPKHKFKNWNTTDGGKTPVTEQMKIDRADKIATDLCNHAEWMSHGRSLKIDDLKPNLKINRIDDDEKLADIVYRIKMVVRLIFNSATVYKIFQTADTEIWKSFAMQGNPAAGQPMPQVAGKPSRGITPNLPVPGAVDFSKPIIIEAQCPDCGRKPAFFAAAGPNVKLLPEQLKHNLRIDEKGFYICDCGKSLDTKPLKNALEIQLKTRTPITFPNKP